MRSIGLAIVMLSLALSSCTALKNFTNTVEQLGSTNVPVAQILTAAQAVTAAEATAKNYIVFCSPNPAPAGCSDDLIKGTIKPDIDKVRAARDAAKQFIKDHPDAKLGPKTLVDAVTSAAAVLQQVLNDHPVASN